MSWLFTLTVTTISGVPLHISCSSWLYSGAASNKNCHIFIINGQIKCMNTCMRVWAQHHWNDRTQMFITYFSIDSWIKGWVWGIRVSGYRREIEIERERERKRERERERDGINILELMVPPMPLFQSVCLGTPLPQSQYWLSFLSVKLWRPQNIWLGLAFHYNPAAAIAASSRVALQATLLMAIIDNP